MVDFSDAFCGLIVNGAVLKTKSLFSQSLGNIISGYVNPQPLIEPNGVVTPCN